MLRRLAPTLVMVLLFAAPIAMPNAAAESDEMKAVVGPSQILYADADTVFFLATKEWVSNATRHQEKLLRTSLRLKYWRDHIGPDMRRVFDALGYPTGRVLSNPIGHTEEAWFYGQLSEPIRFRDGVLTSEDRFEALRRNR